MKPPSPMLFIATASALLDAARTAIGTECLADQFLAEVGARRPSPWNAAFIHHAGYWAHFEHHRGESSWPLPPVASCEELGAFAREANALSMEKPVAGDIFLLRSAPKREFVHAGIVLAAERCGADTRHAGEAGRYECHSIEANITATGRIGGDRIARVRRILSIASGDRVIRWTELAARAVYGEWRAA